MLATPELVLFAVRAGLRLYGAARKGYVDGTRDRPLILPLPRAPGVGFDTAFLWFSENDAGKRVAEQHPRIRSLLKLANPSPEQKSELLDLYLAFRPEQQPGGAPGPYTTEELSALLEIRQWAQGEMGASPSGLKQAAGTLIEIAVDYFAHTPGAVSAQRPEGRALLAFLTAIDDVDFVDTPLRDIAGQLMVAVLDSVSAEPELLPGGEKERLLIGTVTKALAGSATRHLRNAPTTERWEAGVWLQIVGRALLKGGAETVLANPVRFLGVKPGAEALIITQVGTVVADLVIGEEAVTLRRLISAEGAEIIVKSLLGAVASNPDILRVGNDGLRKFLVQVASDVTEFEESLAPDLFAGLTRLLLERSAAHLDLVWPGEAASPENHLLLTACRTVLRELAVKPSSGAAWQPRFTREQVLTVAETVVAEVVDNPGWVVEAGGNSSETLGTAVAAILASLRRLDGRRVAPETAVVILQAGLRAVAARHSLIGRLPDGGDAAGKVAITAALDIVFERHTHGSADDAGWMLGRNSSLAEFVALALKVLVHRGATQANLDGLRAELEALGTRSGAQSPGEFGALLATRLGTPKRRKKIA